MERLDIQVLYCGYIYGNISLIVSICNCHLPGGSDFRDLLQCWWWMLDFYKQVDCRTIYSKGNCLCVTYFQQFSFLCTNGHNCSVYCHGPLTSYVQFRVAHAPGMLRTFPPPPTSKETASWRSRRASRHVRQTFQAFPAHTQPAI